MIILFHCINQHSKSWLYDLRVVGNRVNDKTHALFCFASQARVELERVRGEADAARRAATAAGKAAAESRSTVDWQAAELKSAAQREQVLQAELKHVRQQHQQLAQSSSMGASATASELRTANDRHRDELAAAGRREQALQQQLQHAQTQLAQAIQQQKTNDAQLPAVTLSTETRALEAAMTGKLAAETAKWKDALQVLTRELAEVSAQRQQQHQDVGSETAVEAVFRAFRADAAGRDNDRLAAELDRANEASAERKHRIERLEEELRGLERKATDAAKREAAAVAGLDAANAEIASRDSQLESTMEKVLKYEKAQQLIASEHEALAALTTQSQRELQYLQHRLAQVLTENARLVSDAQAADEATRRHHATFADVAAPELSASGHIWRLPESAR